MLRNLISGTVGPACTKSIGLVTVVLMAGMAAACTGATGSLTGATEGDSGRPRAESIGGTIWVDGNGDGQYTVGEATTVDATVTLWQDANGDGQCGGGDAQVGTMVSDENGAYLFESLSPGRYCVQVGTGATATWTGAVEITSGTGQTLNIALP